MGRDEHEAYLDQLDKKLLFDRKNGIVRSIFDTPHEIYLSDCRIPDEIKFHAKELSISLLDSPSVDQNYVMRRFIRFANEYHKLGYDFESFCRTIDILQISKHARPEYEGLHNDTSHSAALFFNGQYCPTLLFERVAISDETYVKISKRVTLHDTFQVHAQEIDVLQTENFLLLSVTPTDKWVLSSGQPISQFAEACMRHGTRFVLRPCSWEGQEDSIRESLEYIFGGLRFRYERR